MNDILRKIRLSAIALTTVAALSGCNTYLNQKADLRAGGPQQRVAEAQNRLNAENQKNENLEDQRKYYQREADRYQRALAATRSDLSGLNQGLEQARRQAKIDETEYARLKADADSIQREVARIDLEVQAAGNSDPATVKAKEEELKQLKKRADNLQKVITMTTKKS